MLTVNFIHFDSSLHLWMCFLIPTRLLFRYELVKIIEHTKMSGDSHCSTNTIPKWLNTTKNWWNEWKNNNSLHYKMRKTKQCTETPTTVDTSGCEKHGGQIHRVGTTPLATNNTSWDRPTISSLRALSEPPFLTQWWIAQKLPHGSGKLVLTTTKHVHAANAPVHRQNNIQGCIPTKKPNYGLGSSYREGGNSSK
jgi:hypothetical protein